MAFFKFMQGDNRMLTYGLLLVGVIIAFYTIIDRLEDTGEAAPTTYNRLVITDVSFIKLKLGLTEVLLKVPFMPEYSQNWDDNPKVKVNWHIYARGDIEYSGSAMSLLKPPYRSFVFSVQDDLLEELNDHHSERIFLIEERNRILKEVKQLDIEVVHPETGEVLGRFVQRYDPNQRPKESWAY